MGLAYKQLTKQIVRNKIFIVLLFLLTVLTSLMFYFVTFSIDGNMAALNALGTLTENQSAYKTALTSNTFLAYNFLVSLVGLTAFVFIMFFYRFFRSNKKQIGCLKSLGFKDNTLRCCFVVFVAILSVIGAAVGLIGGYFLSAVLINGNMQSYSVTGIVRGISPLNLIIGLGGTTFVFCITAFFCYYFVRGKEPGVLITGNSNSVRFSFSLRMANGLSSIIPTKNKFPFRIAFRKPLAVLLIITAVMSFNVCMILGRSLNISSGKVLESQTARHNYEFDTKYTEFQTTPLPDNAIAYLDSYAHVTANGHEIEQSVIGLYSLNAVYELQNTDGEPLQMMNAGTVYINPGLAETYGMNIGDTLNVTVEGKEQSFVIADVAANAKSAAVYVNAGELTQLLSIPESSYNGVLSMNRIGAGEIIPGDETTSGSEIISRAERIDELQRNTVSNNVSAVINQSVGAVVGAILIFLALYLSFQDNTRDMLILHMMGYRIKNIRRLFVDVYMPIVWAAFILTLAPSVLLAKSIQKSLSISTNDYMPFGTDIIVILIVFVILNAICWLVQSLFRLGIKRVIAKEEMSEFVYAE